MPPAPSPAAAAPLIHTDTLVIGAGQAGLAAAYYLQRHGVDFRLLDAAPTAGHAWDTRYDSLRLFSPAWASGLPGRPWPGRRLRYPTRAETSAYLRDYAAHFAFPLDAGQRVTRLTAAPGQPGYHAHTAAGRTYAARRVIVATGPYTTPKIPAWASQLPTAVAQLPSRDYRRPAQLPGTGPVAVVGSGNSALQIAADIAATGRPVFVAFDEKTPAMPNNQLMWAGLTLPGPAAHSAPHGPWPLDGEPARTRGERRPGPPAPAAGGHLHRHGPRRGCPPAAIQGQRAASPPLDAVVWATGYRPAYDWLELPILEADGQPRHQRGLTAAPGVAFLGLDWLDSRNSALLNGIGADARRVVQALRQMP